MNEAEKPLETKSISPVKPIHARAIIFIAIFLIIIIGGFYWKKSKETLKNTSQNLSNQPAFTAEDYKNFLLGRSKFNFPQISNQTDASMGAIPVGLKDFVLKDGTSLKVQNTNYENKKTGLVVSYILESNNLQSLESKLAMVMATQGDKLVYGERTELVGLLEFSNIKENIRITYTQTTPNIVSVSIQTINLK